MHTPNFKLYEKYVSRVQSGIDRGAIEVYETDGVTDPKQNLVIMNFDKFRSKSPEYIADTFNQFAAPKFMDDDLSNDKLEFAANREGILKMYQQSKNPMLVQKGGGSSFLSLTTKEDIGLIGFDKRSSKPEIMLADALNPGNKNISKALSPILYTKRQIELDDERKNYHEVAHATLGLNEAGADFMATSMMLKRYPDNPEVEKYLLHHADIRFIKGEGLPSSREEYGIENYNAIHEAVRLHHQGQLPNSIEDLYTHAEGFDAQSKENNLNGPSKEFDTVEAKEQSKIVHKNLDTFIADSTPNPEYKRPSSAPAPDPTPITALAMNN